jgi:hypothetical protein
MTNKSIRKSGWAVYLSASRSPQYALRPMSQPPPEPHDEGAPDDARGDDDLPANAFLASLPWWVVLGRDAQDPDSPGYLVLDADNSTCLAVFTDEDLAQRFVDDVGFEGGPLPVEGPEQFESLARRLPDVCQYVAFDPPSRVGARARWVVGLGEVLRAVDRAREDAGE